jgi:dihydroflavonol-4-reductase
MGERGLVTVTGGSGFIAGWCILQLLEQGHAVRATLRSLTREAEVRQTLGRMGADQARLSFVAADLTSDSGWAEAMAGAGHVLHVASPIPPTLPKNDDELVIPARDGALRALRFARDAGVKRVVMTSSTAAITYGQDRSRPKIFTEADWTDPRHPDTSPYIRSKTIAERAAWDFMAKEGGGLELAVVNPGAVLGPVMGRDFSPSIEIVKKLLRRELPACPRLGFPLVDVRDIADLHLRAMTSPAAAGERFLAAGDFFWMADIARVLKERLGSRAARVPTGVLPDWLLRLLAAFDPVTRSVVFEVGVERPFSAAKAKELLGWAPRSNEEAIVATAESLMREGLA